MRIHKTNHRKKLLLLSQCILFLFSIQFVTAQQIPIDYTATKKRESSFKVRLLKQGIIGINTLQHLDLTGELITINKTNTNGTSLSFTLFSTQAIWAGNKNDQLNILSYMHNPVGGFLNGSLMAKIPLSFKKDSSYKLGVRLGQRLIEAFPIDPINSRYFMDNYGSIGLIYQRLLYENARENESLYLIMYPNGIVHNSSAEKREQFFDNQLKTTVFGYGFQLGIELNRKFRFSFMGHQLLNANEGTELGKFVLRFSTGYVF